MRSAYVTSGIPELNLPSNFAVGPVRPKPPFRKPIAGVVYLRAVLHRPEIVRPMNSEVAFERMVSRVPVSAPTVVRNRWSAFDRDAAWRGIASRVPEVGLLPGVSGRVAGPREVSVPVVFKRSRLV